MAGGQVMPQDEIKMVPDEYMDMEINVGMNILGVVTHTPHPGSKVHTVTAGGMMTALHTPLLGTLCTGYTLDKTACFMESWA